MKRAELAPTTCVFESMPSEAKLTDYNKIKRKRNPPIKSTRLSDILRVGLNKVNHRFQSTGDMSPKPSNASAAEGIVLFTMEF